VRPTAPVPEALVGGDSCSTVASAAAAVRRPAVMNRYADLSDDELAARLRARGLNGSEIEIVLRDRDDLLEELLGVEG
jgi:hypothetical protein